MLFFFPSFLVCSSSVTPTSSYHERRSRGLSHDTRLSSQKAQVNLPIRGTRSLPSLIILISSTLTSFIKITICASGTNRTTRTPQHYQILVPEIQVTHLPREAENKWTCFEDSTFIERMEFDLWGALTRPVPPPLPITQKQISSNTVGDDYPWRLVWEWLIFSPAKSFT